jgi:methylated-DNA-[protein]-cysteine S-methyltransferase
VGVLVAMSRSATTSWTRGDVWVRPYESPVGRLTLVAGAAGLQALLWPDDDPDRVLVPHAAPEPPEPRAVDALRRAASQLSEYFAGVRTTFDVPLDPQGTAFELAAWTALRAIPYGRTVTYGEQARRLGDVRKARAVGAANGRNPISIIVPCHRVIGADGSLTGFGGGLAAKAWLLDHERGQGRLA